MQAPSSAAKAGSARKDTRETKLQQGRARLGAESANTTARPPAGRRASTGPRPVGRGEPPLEAGHPSVQRASTGPRPVGRGEVTSAPLADTTAAVLQRGRARLGAESTVNLHGEFDNHALQRGRARVGAERGQRCARPFAEPSLQRGRARLGAESTLKIMKGSTHSTASTGPRPVGRGESSRSRLASARTLRFNGAAPGWARRAAATDAASVIVLALQRGRARLGAESGASPPPPHEQAHASTGPRPVGRGE